jgi:hypothetical protein
VTTLPHPLATVPARSDRGLQRRRRLRLARTRLGLSVQTRLLPTVSASRRTRLHVCGAANTLTALGVRVEVRGPAIPWPRSRAVITTGPIGRLGALAVATVLRGEPISPAADVPADVTVCPLLVRYRLDGRPGHLDDDDVPRSSAEIAALQGLVVEVHLLSPVPPRA